MQATGDESAVEETNVNNHKQFVYMILMKYQSFIYTKMNCKHAWDVTECV